MPYICMIRTDLPDSLLQVVDLLPNTSQRNLIYDGPGQSKYINRGEFTGAAAGTARPTTMADNGSTTTYATYGLAAYFADNIDDINGGGSTFFTSAQANVAANLVAVAVNAGTALTSVAIDAFLNAASAGSGLANGTSTGTVADVLQICAGGSYLLPSGSAVGGLVAAMGNGAFETGTYRTTYDSGSLKISFGAGKISEYMAATWSYPVNGTATAGAALVVYDDDGTVYTG